MRISDWSSDVCSSDLLALLGSGDHPLEGAFLAAADRHRGRVGARIGYDEPLSHLMQAGGDAILIPSRFEPCGLTQLYGLRYGSLTVGARSDKRRVVKECGRTGRVRWWPYNYKNKKHPSISRTLFINI